MQRRKKPKGDGHFIFTKTIRLRNGRILYAWNYGIKAFRIWVAD